MSALSFARGGPVALGLEIGRGGEGAVYQLGSDRAVKLYLKPPAPEKVQKLKAMAAVASPSLLKIAAWPEDLVIDSNGMPHGFVMPRASGGDVHKLYSPKSRQQSFPSIDFRFITHVAVNIARAFATVHQEGHVVGDINHGHCLIGKDGRVILIDCDSFQVASGGQTYSCDVGTPLFTPPELQGRSFRGLRRTADHDNFGLAVLLFHLLFMGRHPFAGVYSGSGEMPVDKAIVERRFAYSTRPKGLTRPPGAVALGAMPSALGQHFEAAFTANGGARPRASDWVSPLEHLKANLKQCAQAATHHYPGHLSKCCWCEVEQATGVRLFGAAQTFTTTAVTVDVAALWRMIETTPAPPPEPTLPSSKPWVRPKDLKTPPKSIKQARTYAALAIMLVGFVGCSSAGEGGGGIMFAILGAVGGWFVWPRVPAEKMTAALSKVRSAETQWSSLLARWQKEASTDVYNKVMLDLKGTRSTLEALPEIRADGIRKLEQERLAEQKLRYLDRFRIDRANIPNIGVNRTTALASFGIETAADIKKSSILRIAGFGEALAGELLKWRASHERNFRFNPAEPVNPAAIARLDAEIEQRRRMAISALQKGPNELRRLSAEIISARARLAPALDRAWHEFKVAQAEHEAL